MQHSRYASQRGEKWFGSLYKLGVLWRGSASVRSHPFQESHCSFSWSSAFLWFCSRLEWLRDNLHSKISSPNFPEGQTSFCQQVLLITAKISNLYLILCPHNKLATNSRIRSETWNATEEILQVSDHYPHWGNGTQSTYRSFSQVPTSVHHITLLQNLTRSPTMFRTLNFYLLRIFS